MPKRGKNLLLSDDERTTLRALAFLFQTTDTEILMRGMRMLIESLSPDDRCKFEKAKAIHADPPAYATEPSQRSADLS